MHQRFSLPLPLPLVVAAVVAGGTLAGCGSSTPKPSTSVSATAVNRHDGSQSQAQQEGVSYARCMRSHGVSNFPDPSANGGFNLNPTGINMASPAAKAAATACASLLPVKTPPHQQPTAAAYARLVHWAQCMRRHGVPGMPDPKPDPPPGPESGGSQPFGTLMGDGGYWVGIPASVNAHSAAFLQLSTRCGENPTGGHHR